MRCCHIIEIKKLNNDIIITLLLLYIHFYERCHDKIYGMISIIKTEIIFKTCYSF
jgi:hypothetical protein